jgi:hypothetical protein
MARRFVEDGSVHFLLGNATGVCQRRPQSSASKSVNRWFSGLRLRPTLSRTSRSLSVNGHSIITTNNILLVGDVSIPTYFCQRSACLHCDLFDRPHTRRVLHSSIALACNNKERHHVTNHAPLQSRRVDRRRFQKSNKMASSLAVPCVLRRSQHGPRSSRIFTSDAALSMAGQSTY